MYSRTISHQIHQEVNSKYWLIRDEHKNSHQITFKLDSGEYFSGLSSLLEVLAEMLENCRKMQKPPTAHHIELIRALREELDFLQNNCQIVDTKSK